MQDNLDLQQEWIGVDLARAVGEARPPDATELHLAIGVSGLLNRSSLVGWLVVGVHQGVVRVVDVHGDDVTFLESSSSNVELRSVHITDGARGAVVSRNGQDVANGLRVNIFVIAQQVRLGVRLVEDVKGGGRSRGGLNRNHHGDLNGRE